MAAYRTTLYTVELMVGIDYFTQSAGHDLDRAKRMITRLWRNNGLDRNFSVRLWRGSLCLFHATLGALDFTSRLEALR